ncbi:MAG: hypothetical protein CMJ46_15220 [Planctomyces sp.]|nr:hypothetical protein [Planctomyces sp.]
MWEEMHTGKSPGGPDNLKDRGGPGNRVRVVWGPKAHKGVQVVLWESRETLSFNRIQRLCVAAQPRQHFVIVWVTHQKSARAARLSVIQIETPGFPREKAGRSDHLYV